MTALNPDTRPLCTGSSGQYYAPVDTEAAPLRASGVHRHLLTLGLMALLGLLVVMVMVLAGAGAGAGGGSGVALSLSNPTVGGLRSIRAPLAHHTHSRGLSGPNQSPRRYAKAKAAVDEDYEEEEELGPVMSEEELSRYLSKTTQGPVQEQWPTGHVGFIALLGRPNVGKSTLLNSLLGYRLTAVTRKPQTTRKRWLGIMSDSTSQMLFLDIPGVHESENALDEAMNASITQAVKEADVVVVIGDPTRPVGLEDGMVATAAAGCRKPLLLVINKVDVADEFAARETENFYRGRIGDKNLKGVFHVSATDYNTLGDLTEAMKKSLPIGQFLYPEEQLTDSKEREIAADMIREVVLQCLQQEVPHSTAVILENWKENRKGISIKASLHVERDSQKGILIGKKGDMMRNIRTRAEYAIGKQMGKPVTLSIFVKVTKDWTKKKNAVEALLY